ncbi:glyoxalase [Leptospira langatensis]|uniref:Glyoxalase n=1 Tax=Leptospira langatensis TaxID=2484983 RepID=A0A5F1ZRS2_9LEPT|nr:VOC family protein [Leptospira langatensis]TGK01833.1 glyoxalase [Leptospira langatensis]TGL39438.1 glyoxalase [Leptospira langatensis]
MKIKLTSIFVHDPIQAFRFYTETLGFISRLYLPQAKLAIVASPEEPNGTGLLLEPNDNPLAKTYQEGLFNAGFPVIVFSTEDIHKEFERLKQNGVVFRSEPTKSDIGIEAVFEDACGNLIQLYQLVP